MLFHYQCRQLLHDIMGCAVSYQVLRVAELLRIHKCIRLPVEFYAWANRPNIWRYCIYNPKAKDMLRQYC